MKQEEEQHKKPAPIGFQVRKLDNMLKRNMQLALSKQGIDEVTAMNGFIIHFLYHNQDAPIYQKDIEQRFKIGKSAVTNVLNRMEEIGLIVRKTEEKDARLKRIILTQKGIEQQELIHQSMVWLDEKQLEKLTKEEREIFFRLLEKLEDNAQEVTDMILGPEKSWIEEIYRKKDSKQERGKET